MDTQVITIMAAMAIAMPVAVGQGPTKPAVPKKGLPEGFVEQSSKALIGEKKQKWITVMRTKLPMAERQIGPFGLAQDPNVKITKPIKQKKREGALLGAIAAMKINTVMPGDNTFTIGSREFSEGDVFPIIHGQRQFNIQIVAVKSANILFKNVDTGEYVKRNLDTLPTGMRKNTAIDTIDGVVPANKKNNNPLNLDDESSVPVTN